MCTDSTWRRTLVALNVSATVPHPQWCRWRRKGKMGMGCAPRNILVVKMERGGSKAIKGGTMVRVSGRQARRPRCERSRAKLAAFRRVLLPRARLSHVRRAHAMGRRCTTGRVRWRRKRSDRLQLRHRLRVLHRQIQMNPLDSPRPPRLSFRSKSPLSTLAARPTQSRPVTWLTSFPSSSDRHRSDRFFHPFDSKPTRSFDPMHREVP